MWIVCYPLSLSFSDVATALRLGTTPHAAGLSRVERSPVTKHRELPTISVSKSGSASSKSEITHLTPKSDIHLSPNKSSPTHEVAAWGCVPHLSFVIVEVTLFQLCFASCHLTASVECRGFKDEVVQQGNTTFFHARPFCSTTQCHNAHNACNAYTRQFLWLIRLLFWSPKPIRLDKRGVLSTEKTSPTGCKSTVGTFLCFVTSLCAFSLLIDRSGGLHVALVLSLFPWPTDLSSRLLRQACTSTLIVWI